MERIAKPNNPESRSREITPEQIAEGKAYYNYEVRPNIISDEQGISVFYKNERGEVFRT